MTTRAPWLIVGGSGFLATNLRLHCEERGIPVLTIGRADGDLADAATCHRLFADLPPVERIFHLATFQRTGNRQFEIPADLLAVNARMHLNVLECWARHQPRAKLISTGSSCAYPETDQPITEAMFQAGPLHPSVRGYGLAKQVLAVGSQLFAEQYGLRWLHCVLATMYGPHDHLEPDRSHFVGAMMSRAIAERDAGAKEFSVWGSPATVREVLYVSDQIDAILAADAAFENTIVNCAANAPVTVGDVAEAILRVLDWKASIVYPAGSFQGTGRKVLDSSRFLAATGWRPRVGLDEGLARLARSLGA